MNILDEIRSGKIKVPSLPRISQEIIKLIKKVDQVTIAELAKVAGLSETVAVSLLRTANSAYYRNAGEVVTIEEAVARLGTNLVCNIILNISLLQVWSDDEIDPVRQDKIWKKSFTTAVSARALAKKMGLKNCEAAFTAGLVANIGIMFMLKFAGRDYLFLLEDHMSNGQAFLKTERDRFGIDHAKLGGEILKIWQLPEQISATAARHREENIAVPKATDNEADKIIFVVQTAVKVSDFFVNADLSGMTRLEYDLMDNGSRIFTTREEARSFFQGIEAEVKEAATVLGLSNVLEYSYEQVYQLAVDRLAGLNLDLLCRLANIGKIASGTAHDLNNVLAATCGSFEMMLLKMPSEDQKKYHDDISMLKQSLDRAKSLVKSVLLYCRKSKSEKEVVDLNAVIDEVRLLFKGSLLGRISIEVQAAPNVPSIMAYTTQIYQILVNMFANAVQAMKEKGDLLEINLYSSTFDRNTNIKGHTLQAGTYCLITVKDNGVGMSSKQLSAIFNPFVSFREKDDGTGLGLAIVYSIVNGMGGVISADSVEGKWSKFTIVLPV